MNVNLSALHAAANGGIEPAYLILKTMHGKTIGLITQHIDLQLELKFIDDSKISFKIPAYDGEEPTALYDELISMRKIEVPTIGTFVLDEPKTEGDGLKEVKEITGYSEERVFANRDILLEQGTYRLYSADDLASKTPTTIMGIAHRLMPKWSIWVDESLYNKYRTFDNTKTGLLGWLRGTAAKAYGCLFNFDSATKTLYVLDANKEYRTNPIYLSYDNLLKKGVRTEYTKEFLTVLNVYGADPVNIREVNPIGSNKIYNLDYFIEIGDIPEDLSNKWRAWQAEIVLAQNNYTTMQLLRNAEMMRRETLNASKRDLEGEATDIENRISVVMQELALTEDEEDREELQDTLEGLVDQKAAKQGEIDDVQDEIDAAQDTIDEHNAALSDIVAELSYNSYFTAEERSILDDYFIEGDFTDETFAVFDVDISGEQDYYEKAEACTISVETDEDEQVEELDLSEVDPGNIINKRVIRVSGGVLTAEIGNTEIEAKILSGTVERDSDTGRTVCSFYTGAGNLTKSNSVTTFVNANVNFISSDSTLQNGDNPLSNAVLSECSAYFTKNKTQFESYAVQQQLFDHAAEQHRAIAYPTCEFDIESGNVIYAEEFEPFKDVLRLGEGVYLDFGDGTVLTPLLLEMHFSFDDPSKFDLIFSNSYSRSGSVKTMKDLLAESHVSARTLEMSKYNYGAFTRSGAESEVSKLFTQGLDAATKQILAGMNNSVVIDGSGITIRSSDDETVYLKMNNGMFAFMDGSDTAKLAIGKFYDTGMGQVMYGIVAPNIVGTLLAGENLIIQSPKFDGTNMYFSVDADGVRLANGQFDIYKISSQEGLSVSEKSISIDPNLGILGGDLDNAIAYDQNGAVTGVKIMNGNTLVGTVTSIADAKANYLNSIQHLTPNFWLDLNGDAFFRGTIYATDGYFSGTVHATDGEFSGTLNAPTLTGTMVAGSGGVIRGARIEVGGANYDKFVVTSSGDVYLDGNIHMTGQIDWGDNTGPDSGGGEYDEYIDEIIKFMEDNDSEVTAWFYAGPPALNQPPSNAWNTDTIKDQHIGDYYYDKTNDMAYRFAKSDNGTYSWVLIDNTITVEVLRAASKAQDTADGKRRTFYGRSSSPDNYHPDPPYDPGDLWLDGNDILVCTVARTGASGDGYNRQDWAKYVNYTDDSVARSIAEGEYDGGAFIDGNIIKMPIIAGGRLYGAISLQVGANDNNITADDMLEYNYNFAVSQDGSLGIGYNSGAQSSHYRNFYVDSNGNVTMRGSITLGGNITWGSGTSPTQVVYSEPLSNGTALSKPVDGTLYNNTNFQESDSSYWHRKMSASDMYASYTYDGGLTWTIAVKIVGTDGAPGPQGQQGQQGPQGPKGDSTEATVTRASILQALTAGTNGIDGIYKATVNGQECIRINATYIDAGVIDTARLSSNVITTNNLSAQNISATQITAGTLNANNITTTGHFTFKYNPDFMGEITYGTMGQYSGSTTNENGNNITTYGTAMYGKDNNFLITCTDYGARMSNDTSDTRVYVDENHAVLSSLKGPKASVSVNNAGGVVVSGTTFTWNSAAVSTSDIRRKHDISYDMEKYIPFILALKTARFKYNDGTSNRFHSGFVAQDVKKAMDEAGLSTQEFAGYVSVNEIDDNGEVSGTYLGLRYEEFISLNTYMIQKLYARIEELENRVALLSGGNE